MAKKTYQEKLHVSKGLPVIEDISSDVKMVHGRHEVVVIVLQRLLHRLAHGLQPSEIDHAIDLMVLKHPIRLIGICHLI